MLKLTPKLPFASAGPEAGNTTRTAASAGITSRYFSHLLMLLPPFALSTTRILKTPDSIGSSGIAFVCERFSPHRRKKVPPLTRTERNDP